MPITKPPVLPAWADTAVPTTDIVQPTNPEISAGWLSTTTPPSRQRFNWILNFCANAVRYFSRRGVADWDAAETYMNRDIVRGDDGLLYRSLQDNNANRTPSVSPTWWAGLQTQTRPAGDNSAFVATTAFVQAEISLKANTTGNYPGLTVGNATAAASAAVASSAGTVPWTGVTGKPTTVAGYGITDAITTANIGSQSVAFATTAERARPRRGDNVNIDFHWSGQGGQPNWLLGSNDGVNFYVWNPANFSVNYATNAALAPTQAPGTSDTRIATTQFANPAQSHAINGYVKLPGGIIMQWGSVNFGNLLAGSYAHQGFVAFPVAFPSAVFQIVFGKTGNGTSALAGGRFITTSSFQIYMEEWAGAAQGGDNTATWFAIGV